MGKVMFILLTVRMVVEITQNNLAFVMSVPISEH